MNNEGSNSFFRIAGYLACAVLIVGGLATIFIGASGRSEVNNNLKLEQIQGTPDMKPDLIAENMAKAGLTGVEAPSCDVAGQVIDNGTKAKCFASYMRIHALMSTDGRTYAQMPQYATTDGKGTDDVEQAKKDPATGKAVDYGPRNIWVSEVAFSQALNMAFLASQIGLFSMWMGVALILIGIGLLVTLLGLAARTRPRTA